MEQLKNLAKNPRMLAYVGGGAVVLFLLYRYFAGRSTTGAGQQNQPTPDQTGLTAAEQVGAQEASDVSQLQSDIGGLQGTIDQLTGQVQGLIDQATGSTAPEVATGGTKVHRHTQKHPGKARNEPKHGGRRRPRPDHPKGHQSNRKHGGTGAVAPSHHGPHGPTKGGWSSTLPAPRGGGRVFRPAAKKKKGR